MITELPEVYVVDDDAAILRALARLLQAHGYRVCPFQSPADFLCSAMLDSPGCAILDMHMPEFNGLELQRQILGRQSPLGIIFLTAHGRIDQCVEAVKSGAVDFLSKPVEDTVLLSAVNQALMKSHARHLVQMECKAFLQRYRTLSAREREVCALVVTGLLNKQVAAQLGASEKTIKIHRGRVMAKMQAGSLPDLVTMISRLSREGLIR
ncbi:MAG: response regulator [Verrucomicrobia bacterium]|nr:response regulator [Verrucomicrobiota bacterium]